MQGVGGNVDLTLSSKHATLFLLKFIDKKISGFHQYYSDFAKTDKENYITNLLVNYFNSWLLEDSEGYIPYKFSFQKNPAHRYSTKETDVGIYVLNPSVPTDTIFEFEAKRLSDTSNNSEYVYGSRGGIERFKRNQHASHLTMAGMFGYIQSQTTAHWIDKINEWITTCNTNSNGDIDWSKAEEKLLLEDSSEDIAKYKSVNSRSNNPPIQLSHYFINLIAS
jgi:hypothetical protein